jgi:outer membrane receptor protein involved in Fe transport
MTKQNVEAIHRLKSRNSGAGYLVSAAVVAALTGSAVPQRAAAADGDPLEEVTVTGSRIVRTRDLEAPSPIITLDRELFEKSASTGLEAVLNQQPQFVPQATQFTSGVQGSPTFTPGAVTLNLRGLGPNRNLVLVDGRRGQPGNATLAVDINTIPQLAVQGVETITGGASAVYGPDAMAGVVNFVLKKNFQGLDFDVQRGETSHSDGAETRVSALIGMNGVDDRGNMMIGLEWARRDAVFQSNRDFYTDGWLDPDNPSGGFIVAPEYAPSAGNQPSQDAIDSLFPGAGVGRGTTIYFNSDKTPFIQGKGGLGYNGPLNSLEPGRYQAMKVLGSGTGTSAGNLDQAITEGFASIPSERHSLFARGTFNFSDSVSAYAQLNYNTSEVLTRSFGFPPAVTIWQANIPRYNSTTPGAPQDSTWLPPALLTLLNSRVVNPDAPPGTTGPDAPWSLYQLQDYTGFEVAKNSTDVWQGLAGLQGTLPFRDWTWDAYVSRGNTHVQQDFTGMNSLQRYQYLVSLPNFGKGANVASPPGTPFGYGVTCTTGLPVFDQFEVSQDCIDSIASPLKNETQLRQDIVEANLQGKLLNVPAGDVRFSVGAAYRSESFDYSPGYPQGAITDNPIGLFASAYTSGDINVKEAYTEFLVPIVKNLDLELGYRFSDFNTAGGTDTYKALFSWKALPSLSFRGGYQAATRAPNVAELFQGPTQAVVAFPQEDPCSASTLAPWGNVPSNPDRLKVQQLCRELIGNSTSEFDTQDFNKNTFGTGPDGWTRQSPTFFPLEIEVQTGNPKVAPETGRTVTFGFVLTEPFGVSKLAATLDAYRIKISDTISPQSSISTYNNCFNFDGASNPTYDVNNPNCKLIQRNPQTGDRATVTALYSNLGTLLTQGLDLTVNWAHDIGPGQLRLDTSVNYVNKFEYQTSPTSPVVDAKGTLDPIPASAGVTGGIFTYRTFSRVGYSWNALSVGLGWQHLPSIRAAAASVNPTTTIQGAKSYDLLYLSAGYVWDKYSFRIGVDNVLDKDPPTVQSNPGVTTASNVTNPGFYDVLGRRWYVGVKATF